MTVSVAEIAKIRQQMANSELSVEEMREALTQYEYGVLEGKLGALQRREEAREERRLRVKRVIIGLPIILGVLGLVALLGNIGQALLSAGTPRIVIFIVVMGILSPGVYWFWKRT